MNRLPSGQKPDLEIWGGVECSFVRLGWGNYDQLARTGHADRDADLEKFSALGLRTLRYPMLWERHAGDPIDWRWADRRLHRLRELGIRPIVGLLHHGCGPLPGGFLDPNFVDGLARFAGEVAARYPWIDAYTPINEPLTTARFSGLYGLWHPFQRDPASFARIFLKQCQAIRAAMKAVRAINPEAQLIQTEDLGKTHATELLAYQAEWENERRWLTFDILNGRLGPELPLWHYLRSAGIGRAELDSFRDEPCVPALLGMNHYITGERFLDERVKIYPAQYRGGNGRHRYVDVPAVRVRARGVAGATELMRELWHRFTRPMAVTEVQIACTREEQLRWLAEIWNGARQIRDEGADIRAVTAWALVGGFDWDSLLRELRNNYEAGAFDIRGDAPEKTALAWAIRSLAVRGTFDHPVLDTPGWWRRSSRLHFKPVKLTADEADAAEEFTLTGRPLLVAGAPQPLERIFNRLSEERGLKILHLPTSASTDEAFVAEMLDKTLPWGAIIVQSANPPTAGGAERAATPGGQLGYLFQFRHIPFEIFFAPGQNPNDTGNVRVTNSPIIGGMPVPPSGWEGVNERELAVQVHALLDRVIDHSFAGILEEALIQTQEALQ